MGIKEKETTVDEKVNDFRKVIDIFSGIGFERDRVFIPPNYNSFLEVSVLIDNIRLPIRKN